MPFDNKKQILIIGLALFAGIVAAVLASNWVSTTVQNKTQQLAEQYDAKQKEIVGQIQQRNDQQMALMAQEIESVKAEAQQEMQKEVAAAQAAQQAKQAQARPAEVRHPSIALKTPVGKRAVTVQINSLAAVGGLINPGDLVDVIAQLNMPSPETEKKTVTAMIFQNLQVLAINTNEDDPGAYDEQQAQASLKITFAVDPQEAGLLAFADKNGTLELALRSPDDSQTQKVKANTWKTLADYVLKNQGLDIRNPDGEAGGKPEEVKPNIQIFRGGKEL